MVYKTLEITLISAKDLKNVNLIGKMDVYVAVHLSDDPKNKQKTPVHQDGGTNPSWNYTIRLTVDDANASKPGKYVVFTLKHEQTFGSDKELGEVIVPLKDLLEGVKDPNSPQVVTYQVRRVTSGKPQGELKLSYKFTEMPQNFAQSYSSSSSSTYPPPAGYGNFYPPPPNHAAAGVPYPPPQSTGVPYPPPAEATGVPYPPSESQGKPAVTGMPYPPPPPQGYPYQAHGTGIPYAAPPGYPPYGGYPPPPHGGGGYGYPPPPQQGYMQKPQKPKKNNFGMGLGAGLLGGALGGLVLGEMMDDAFDVDCDF